MDDGIWWLLVPGFVGCAVAMYCIYHVLRLLLFSNSLLVHDIHKLTSADFDWQWSQLLQTTLGLGIAFACICWPAATLIRRYFEPSDALYDHVYARQAAVPARAR